jgi:hypothetical protein
VGVSAALATARLLTAEQASGIADATGLVGLTSGRIVSGASVDMVVSAADNVRVVSVALCSGTTRLGSVVQQADGTRRATCDSRRYPNGAYAVTAKAIDAAGNIGTSAPITVAVRN